MPIRERQTPFVVAVNRFEGPEPALEKVRSALSLADDIPLDKDSDLVQLNDNLTIAAGTGSLPKRAGCPR